MVIPTVSTLPTQTAGMTSTEGHVRRLQQYQPTGKVGLILGYQMGFTNFEQDPRLTDRLIEGGYILLNMNLEEAFPSVRYGGLNTNEEPMFSAADLVDGELVVPDGPSIDELTAHEEAWLTDHGFERIGIPGVPTQLLLRKLPQP